MSTNFLNAELSEYGRNHISKKDTMPLSSLSLPFLWFAFAILLSSLILSCAFPFQQVPTRHSSETGIVVVGRPLNRRFRLFVSDNNNNMASTPPTTTTTNTGIPQWFQHEITITAPSRGCHLITGDIQKAISKDLGKIRIGMCNLFVQHTSASLTINENADPDVRRDMEVAMNKIVPASWNRDGTFWHTMEGDDDMPGHVKSSLMGASINIPIRNGRLALGTWQGVYLNEHRDQGGWGGGHSRHIVITLQGTA